jgi:hypothetical protein
MDLSKNPRRAWRTAGPVMLAGVQLGSVAAAFLASPLFFPSPLRFRVSPELRWLVGT